MVCKACGRRARDLSKVKSAQNSTDNTIKSNDSPTSNSSKVVSTIKKVRDGGVRSFSSFLNKMRTNSQKQQTRRLR